MRNLASNEDTWCVFVKEISRAGILVIAVKSLSQENVHLSLLRAKARQPG